MLSGLLVLAFAYLLGSIPTGVWVAQRRVGRDIRLLGDGNTGARNVTHVLGWKAGIFTALVDALKGALAVLLAKTADLDPVWINLAGLAAVIGHDFPLFAGFRGGQGMATISGVMLILAPLATTAGLLLFGAVYLITRHFDPSAAAGFGTLVFLLIRYQYPAMIVGMAIALLLTIPLKKWIDRRRVAEIKERRV